MKLREISRTLLQSTIMLTYLSTVVQATPLDALARVIHLAERQLESGISDALFNHDKRGDCANPCGYYGQLCCQSAQSCITDSAGQAQCAANAAASSVSAPAPTGGSSPKCDYAADESACGSQCCKSGFYCSVSFQCVVAGNGGFTTTGVVGTIPARPTTISGVIVTQTVSPTTTMAFQTPATTGPANATASTSGGGLSGGAIAGIVIGVLLGLALLWLLIFCLCLDALLTCLGIRKKKRSRGSRTEVIDEEYIRHHRHGASAAGGGRMWVGGSRRSSSDRHSRPSRPPPKKKTGWLGALAAGAATAAAVSFFSKNKKKKSEKTPSSYSGSSYDSYYSYDDSLESRSRAAGSRMPSAGPSRSRYTSRTRSVRH